MGLDGKIAALNLNIQLDCQLIKRINTKNKHGKKNKKKNIFRQIKSAEICHR